MITTQHSIHSSYREMVLEHLFVGEVMRYCWRNHLPRIEMLKSQVDNSGYDIVLEAKSIMRHIQLKSSHVGAATPGVNINVELANKPSGCVVWTFFEPKSLEFSHFLWLGRLPGERLGSLEDYKTATHNKRNAKGIKTARANIKYLTKAAFTPLGTIDDVVAALFGEQRKGVLEEQDSVAVKRAGGSLIRACGAHDSSPVCGVG